LDKQVRLASFDFQALLACAAGELFGPGNAKLPLPPLLMFDKISHICDFGGLFGKGEIPRGIRDQAGSLVLQEPTKEEIQSSCARPVPGSIACEAWSSG